MSVLRNAALFAAALCALTACAPKAPDTAADVAAIKASEQDWFKSYNASDAAGVAALYAEDGVVLAPGVPAAVGRAAIKTFLVSDIANAKAAGLTDHGDEVTDVGIAGDNAWVTGAYFVTDTSKATVDKGKYVTIYRRAEGKWLIIRDTWNSDMPPAAASAPAPRKVARRPAS
jgi:uncharacterized protein (TIGR02246 family)